MTPVFSYLHFFSAVVYLILMAFVLYRDPKALLNRLCAGVLFCFMLWSGSMVFVHLPSVAMETADLAEDIGALGWINFSGLFFLFAAVFSRKFKVIPVALAIILPFQGFLLFLQWKGLLLENYQLRSFGWIAAWSSSRWPLLFFAYYGIMVLCGFYLVFLFRRHSSDPVKKRQSDIILGAAVVPLVLGTVSNVLFRQSGNYDMPPLADVFVLFWAFGIAYAISRYKFMSITPTMAADKIVSTMADSVVLVDLQGAIVYSNEAALDLLAYGREELEGLSMRLLVREDSLAEGMEAGLLWNKVRDREAVFLTKKKKEIPVCVSSTPLAGSGFVLVFRDITLEKQASIALQKMNLDLERKVEERTRALSLANVELSERIAELKKTQASLGDSEERFKILFEDAPDAYYLSDLYGTFVDGNKQSENITGYRKEELIGQSFLRAGLLPVAQVGKAAGLLARSVLGRRTGPDDFTLVRKDGSKVHLEISTFPVTINKQKLILGIARDVSTRKEVEEEHRRLEERLHQSQKLESIGQLAGGIAHDFNNLLGAISGYADLIRRDPPAAATKALKYAEKIIEVSRQAADLISKLLAFARKGKQEKAPVDMHTMLKDVVEILEHTLGKNITIRQDLQAGDCTVIGDRAQLQNSLINMAINSRDAMPDGGTLTFETRATELNDTYAASRSYAVMPGSYFLLTVRDTGTGMDPETLARVFEPFFTTKEKGKGTGLGLSSVYGIVKSHEGYIDLESEPGRGTTFYLYLPLSGEHKTDPLSKTTSILIPGSGTILLIDDDDNIREVATDILKGLRYKVVSCRDGKEGAEAYRKQQREIDLVVLDMIMPGMSGYDCFQEMKKINPKVKVLVISGYATDQEIEKIMAAGAKGFLPKPFHVEKLSMAVKEALEL